MSTTCGRRPDSFRRRHSGEKAGDFQRRRKYSPSIRPHGIFHTIPREAASYCPAIFMHGIFHPDRPRSWAGKEGGSPPKRSDFADPSEFPSSHRAGASPARRARDAGNHMSPYCCVYGCLSLDSLSLDSWPSAISSPTASRPFPRVGATASIQTRPHGSSMQMSGPSSPVRSARRTTGKLCSNSATVRYISKNRDCRLFLF
jgi:hypothetical protein